MSKIGLAKLNDGQREELCVKLVAPLQHNQMMWHHFKGGHVLATAFCLNQRAEEWIQISFIEVEGNNLLLNRTFANEDSLLMMYMN